MDASNVPCHRCSRLRAGRKAQCRSRTRTSNVFLPSRHKWSGKHERGEQAGQNVLLPAHRLTMARDRPLIGSRRRTSDSRRTRCDIPKSELYPRGVRERDQPEVWRPITGMPSGAHGWGLPGYAEEAAEWHAVQTALKDRRKPRIFLDGWLKERGRAFAIETGQIEGLYTLRRGITEQLVAEGLTGVVSAHTLEGVEDRTIKGLLADQETAYNLLFGDVADGLGLTQHKIKAWHQLLTRHQETVTGFTIDGRRVQVTFTHKGQWKIRPNNPRRPDGVVHEYCPPEHVQAEMDRFIDSHREIEAEAYPVEVEAAWMHHRFVRTHPFQDGNGRVSRMLMAYAYVKRGLPPPVIAAQFRPEYISSLEEADGGDLRAFSDFLGPHGQATLRAALLIGRRALAGNLNRPNGNGGRTVGNRYYPPAAPELGW